MTTCVLISQLLPLFNHISILVTAEVIGKLIKLGLPMTKLIIAWTTTSDSQHIGITYQGHWAQELLLFTVETSMEKIYVIQFNFSEVFSSEDISKTPTNNLTKQILESSQNFSNTYYRKSRCGIITKWTVLLKQIYEISFTKLQ